MGPLVVLAKAGPTFLGVPLDPAFGLGAVGGAAATLMLLRAALRRRR